MALVVVSSALERRQSVTIPVHYLRINNLVLRNVKYFLYAH